MVLEAWWLSWLERRPDTAEVVGSNPIRVVNTGCVSDMRSRVCHFLIMYVLDGFPSGQRGQTVNLLSTTSVVRIHPHPFGILAQLGEHLPYKQRVIGSSPIGPIFLSRGRAVR